MSTTIDSYSATDIQYALKKARQPKLPSDSYLGNCLTDDERAECDKRYRELLPHIRRLIRRHIAVFRRSDEGALWDFANHGVVAHVKEKTTIALLIHSLRCGFLTLESWNRKHHQVDPQFEIDDETGKVYEPFDPYSKEEYPDNVPEYTPMERVYIDIARQIDVKNIKYAPEKFRTALKEMFGYDDDKINCIIAGISDKMFA